MYLLNKSLFIYVGIFYEAQKQDGATASDSVPVTHAIKRVSNFRKIHQNLGQVLDKHG